MTPKAKTDLRPEPKPSVVVRTQQVLTMLGILLMFAMALSWLWTPTEEPDPPASPEVESAPVLDKSVQAVGRLHYPGMEKLGAVVALPR